jgi:single-strand DNA-binding protein
MAKDINSVQISGRLGADPELRYLPSGSSVANFRIASSRPFKRGDNSDWEEETTWASITAWGSLGERVNDSFGKGDRVIVIGRLRLEEWDDKNGGGKRSKISIVADNVQPMGEWRDFVRSDDDEEGPRESGPADDVADDLPF